MKKPNFFIVGAPKCGTTAFASYLGELPDVFMTSPKEPHFFANDFPGYRQIERQEDYESLFRSATRETVLGEASVFYLYSEVALKNISLFNPNAKILVMLRNPIDLVYSLHSQLLFTHDENISDFAEAWNQNDHRRSNQRVPKRCRESKFLQYDRIGMLGEQMQRLYQVFPRDQVLVIFFSDFVSNTEFEFQRAVDFLAVEGEARSSFPRINENRRHRSPFLASILFNRNRWLRRPLAGLKRVLGIKEIGLMEFLRRAEMKHETRKPLAPSFRMEIRANYADDISLLERLVDQKLDHWT